MICQQKLSFKEKPNNILKEILEKGIFEEPHNPNIIIKYYGNKNQIPINISKKKNNIQEKNDDNQLNDDDPRNSLLFIKYENIYIGAVSIKDISQRENFGLNIFSEQSFYIGQWKDNMKEGIGFLKIDENLMYIGNFGNNQFDGFGILYNKINGDYFFGDFNQGGYEGGIIYNEINEYFYRGKIKEGKKNDELCTYFDAKNGNLFVGEIVEDEYNKGYLAICQITEEKNNEEEEEEGEFLNFNIQKIFYFDGYGANNKSFVHYNDFSEDFYAKIQDIINNIFQADYNLKDLNESFKEFFIFLEGIKNNPDYIQNIENYNSFQNNEQCFENEFISNYYNFYQKFKTGQEMLDLKEYENFLAYPEVKNDQIYSL